MIKTDVDEVLHAGALNTAWYRAFCGTFLDEFIDHTPLDDETGALLDDGVLYILAKLETTYGDSLHPALRVWRQMVESNDYEVVRFVGRPLLSRYWDLFDNLAYKQA